ncbi:hypothetical protein RUM43_000619 [Polyplax serrata]|uniref:ZNF380 coiled-coil domain-containing protein n=1 Tax=Polyplax serrata TaxID=468196 RepID=A0AAN8XSK4_POLSC
MASSKKKLTQSELRRLMSEQKKKLQSSVKKIDSPLAKYPFTCMTTFGNHIWSENVWSVHLNSKNHKQNILLKVKKKEPQPQKEEFKEPLPSTLKRSAPVAPVPVPPKKIKGILKNSSSVRKTAQSEALHTNVEDVDDDSIGLSTSENSDIDMVDSEVDNGGVNPEALPEGFFDDPKLDAKARNVEYRDPIEEEWERFQKEIKEETSKAQEIIAEDQEEATTERQIDEIDEQMRNWSRVLNLEKKKEKVSTAPTGQIPLSSREEFSDDEEFEEFLDWRSKKSFDYKLNKLLKT